MKLAALNTCENDADSGAAVGALTLYHITTNFEISTANSA